MLQRQLEQNYEWLREEVERGTTSKEIETKDERTTALNIHRFLFE